MGNEKKNYNMQRNTAGHSTTMLGMGTQDEENEAKEASRVNTTNTTEVTQREKNQKQKKSDRWEEGIESDEHGHPQSHRGATSTKVFFTGVHSSHDT